MKNNQMKLPKDSLKTGQPARKLFWGRTCSYTTLETLGIRIRVPLTVHPRNVNQNKCPM